MGVVIGFLGVVLLVGAQPSGDVLSALAVLLTASCYAAAALFAGIRLAGAPPIVTSLGTLVVVTVTMLPLGVAQLPAELPGWKAIASVVALGSVGLSVAYVLYFALIARAGASYAVLVTYLVPALALGYGAVFSRSPSPPWRLAASRSSSSALRSGPARCGSRVTRPWVRRRSIHPTHGRVLLSELLHEHVERFNAAVDTADWGPMLEQFEDTAEMEFRGVPVGPFDGKEAIKGAYREQPPDDKLRILEERTVGGRVEARYAWLAEPDVAAGEMFLTHDGGRISRLIITFDRGVAWS